MFNKSLALSIVLTLLIPFAAGAFAEEMNSHNIIRSEHRKTLNLKRKHTQDLYAGPKSWPELESFLTPKLTAEDKTYIKMVMEEHAHLPFSLPRLDSSHDGWVLKSNDEKAQLNPKVKTITFGNRMMIFDKKSLRSVGEWMDGQNSASKTSQLFLGLAALMVTVGIEHSTETCVQDYASMNGRLDQALKDCSVVATSQASCLRVVEEEFQTFGQSEMASCLDESTKKSLCEKAEKLSQCMTVKNKKM